MPWDPAQYLRFASARLRPALDLLARIEADTPATVVDLGCGTGNVTALLAARWPDADVVGVDDSPEMLARAAADHPGLRFVAGDVSSWRPDRPAAVVYSNAALHWLDDHDRLFPDLLGAVARGGTLAVQMPRNHHAPSHTAVAAAVAAGPWAGRLRPLLRPFPVREPAFYHDLLAPAAALDIWETEYLHVLTGDDPVAEWTRGSLLRPLLAALDADIAARFYADYSARIAAAYPRRADGTTLFPFRRLFIVARRPG